MLSENVLGTLKSRELALLFKIYLYLFLQVFDDRCSNLGGSIETLEAP